MDIYVQIAVYKVCGEFHNHGIVNSVIMLLHAVSDTDNATSPLAIMEKMLDELPPGEQAMSMMPIKNRGSSWKTCPKANASIGSGMIWPPARQ